MPPLVFRWGTRAQVSSFAQNRALAIGLRLQSSLASSGSEALLPAAAVTLGAQGGTRVIGAQTCLDWSRLVHWVSVKSQRQVTGIQVGRAGIPEQGRGALPGGARRRGRGWRQTSTWGGGERLPDAGDLVLLASVSQAVLVASVRFSIVH